MPKIVLLWTDAAVWLLVAALLAYGVAVVRHPGLSANWRKVFRDGPALASAMVLGLCLLVTLADSVHYRLALPRAEGSPHTPVAHETRTRSLLDAMLADLINGREVTYSRPLAYVSFTKDSITLPGGRVLRVEPRLHHGGAHLRDPNRQWAADIANRTASGFARGTLLALFLVAALIAALARSRGATWREVAGSVWRQEGEIPWRTALWTVLVLALLIGVVQALMGGYHVLGTDTTGNDVLYQAMKSIRTAFVIGSLATLATLPLAVVLGIMAGYFGGWVDEAIQYLYTVLSSVPNVLLIAACVLMVQVFLDKHPELFETAVERADLKLFLLCTVLGLTGWAGLCRLLRGETLKLRELEYVQAARAFGVSHTRIMWRHIFPNVAHLMLIVTVLEFSTLILYEAVLSYVGVGVDPSMNSFGGMINFARKEMSRDPVVWWSFAAAFGFMVTVVLAANLFADGVRDAFDPRARHFRRRLAIRPPARPRT
ncbi:ABC transporter permease [Aquabacterium sp.]|uniref:ABC transporter permease n=1 Tax=Aquabacterium sp. TaxID=1872578 RepID=UPI003D6D4EDC